MLRAIIDYGYLMAWLVVIAVTCVVLALVAAVARMRRRLVASR
jgi:uncharacterized membrane protein YedE/YeeE